MNKEQSLQLFEEGNRAWNAWADERLAERKALEESGDWIDGDPGKWNEQTRAWHEMAEADFSGHRFETEARFDHFRFPGDAVFERVSFLESARFDRCEFLGKAEFSEVRITGFCGFADATFRATALFDEAAFMGDVSFPGVNFSNDTRFNRAKFRGEAHFNGTQFKGAVSFEWAAFSGRTAFLDAEFSDKADFRDAAFSRRVVFGGATFSDAVTFEQSSFEGPAYFGGSSFAQYAEFRAIRGKGLFSLNNVKFSRVPDFSEAHFEEAPRFDNVDLKPERFRKIGARKSELDPSRRWRALRRLAIQGQDHERELQFLKGEIAARRGTQDKLFHLRFWVGWLYQILSDFGRSMVRPLLWLGIGLVGIHWHLRKSEPGRMAAAVCRIRLPARPDRATFEWRPWSFLSTTPFRSLESERPVGLSRSTRASTAFKRTCRRYQASCQQASRRSFPTGFRLRVSYSSLFRQC